jgi:hypothetical protein
VILAFAQTRERLLIFLLAKAYYKLYTNQIYGT